MFFKDFKNGAMEKLHLETNIPDAHSMDITALRASQLYSYILLSGSSSGEIKVWDLS